MRRFFITLLPVLVALPLMALAAADSQARAHPRPIDASLAADDDVREEEIDEEDEADEEDPEDRAIELYEDAKDALDESDYDEAVRLFNRVINMKARRADGATYWKAYALARMGQRAQALTTLERLRKDYAASRWIDDARALELEIRGSSGQTPSPEGEDKEELKLMALNSLMNMDPERAVPMLEKLIASGSSARVKEQALFVLVQTGTPRARQVVTDIARGRSNPDLQRKAIENLGIFGDSENRAILKQIYASTTDSSIRRAILNAYMISGDTESLLAAARDTKESSVRSDAISLLGAQGAADELIELYRVEPLLEVREQILNAMGIGSAIDALLEAARTEKDARLRGAAVRSLGLTDSSRSGPALISLYAAERDIQVRKTVFEALMIQGNARALVDLARKEKNPELKRAAVEKLSVMGSKEATDYLLELLGE